MDTGEKEEVQVPARISSPTQLQWVALALCCGSVATGCLGGRLAGLVEELDLGILDGLHGNPGESGLRKPGRR